MNRYDVEFTYYKNNVMFEKLIQVYAKDLAEAYAVAFSRCIGEYNDFEITGVRKLREYF